MRLRAAAIKTSAGHHAHDTSQHNPQAGSCSSERWKRTM